MTEDAGLHRGSTSSSRRIQKQNPTFTAAKIRTLMLPQDTQGEGAAKGRSIFVLSYGRQNVILEIFT